MRIRNGLDAIVAVVLLVIIAAVLVIGKAVWDMVAGMARALS